MVGDYYPFGLTMAGISSKALSFGGPENKYKFNDATELNTDFGLGWYETMNRSYDPQIGRFLQIDEFGEVSDEWSPYVFGNNNPVSFNDPLGLFAVDPEKPKETSTAENPTELSNVTVVGVKGGLWAQTRFYYRIMDYTGGNLDLIENYALRAQMKNIDGIVKHRERVAEMTRAQDKITLEAASWFIPYGNVFKALKFKKVFALFKLKRGKAVVNVAEEAVEQAVTHGDEAVSSGSSLVQANRTAGNTFRDELAAGLRAEGRVVETEVYKKTPFGKRHIDLDVWHNGINLGGIETKVGGSRYHTLQRLKDLWLEKVEGYPVNLVRRPENW